MPRWFQIALCFVSCGASPAMAEVRAAYVAAATEGSEAWAYLQGLANGIEWAVSRSRFDKEPAPFCAPPNLAITPEQYRQILRRQIELHPEQSRQWAGLVMMDALKRTFPCEGKK